MNPLYGAKLTWGGWQAQHEEEENGERVKEERRELSRSVEIGRRQRWFEVGDKAPAISPNAVPRRSALGGGRMEELVDGLYDQDEGEDDHGDSSNPGDEVKEEPVGVLAHEIFAVHQEQDEDDDDGEPDAVPDLRKDQDFPERCVGEEDDSCADDNEQCVEPVEGRGFAKFVVDPGFEAKAFANDVGGRERKNSGGEERGVKEAEGER